MKILPILYIVEMKGDDSMIKKIEDFKVRFNKALSARNIKPVELSEKTGISESTISQYRSGYAKPKEKKLALIADALNVNPTWLMGLDVPMEYKRAITLSGHTPVDIVITSDNAQYIIEEEERAREFYMLYSNASPEIQRAVETILKSSQQTS